MSAAGASILRFGVFELDLTSGQLRKSGALVKLQPQPIKVLALLASRPNQVVTREEIQQQIWGQDTFVDFEHGLNFCIKQIRAALDDSADNPRYVETLPRRGYRFLYPVEGLESAPEPAATPPVPPVGPTPAPPDDQRDQGRERTSISRWVALALLLLAVLAVGYLFRDVIWPREQTLAGKPMLVVLPFENLSDDPEQKYFSDGLADELSTQLGQVSPEGLGVIGRESAEEVADMSINEIGDELGVDYVLDGSVLRAGDRVRITAKLIQVSDRTELWAKSYERELADFLAIHRDVAQNIAQSLALELLPAQQAARGQPPATDFETFELYLRGRHFLGKRTPQDLLKGLEYFQQAVEREPEFALAYAGQADAYMLLGSTQYGPILAPGEALPQAKAAAERALEIDDTLAEAHCTLAHIRVEYEWDWAGAERAFRQAISLNPSYPTAHRWYSLLLSKLGRVEEARAEINRAKALDPLSPIVNVAVGWQHYLAREYDQAAEQFQKTLEMEPNFPLAHFVLGITYGQAGKHEEAMAEFERVVELSQGSPPALAGVGYAHALLGHESAARSVLAQMNQLSGQYYVSGIYFAAVYAALGEKDEAFKWLDKAYGDRADYLSYLKVEPVFDPLRDDPRFAKLLRRVGLP